MKLHHGGFSALYLFFQTTRPSIELPTRFKSLVYVPVRQGTLFFCQQALTRGTLRLVPSRSCKRGGCYVVLTEANVYRSSSQILPRSGAPHVPSSQPIIQFNATVDIRRSSTRDVTSESILVRTRYRLGNIFV